MDTIRVGMLHCDCHAAWYGLLFAPADELACLEYHPACHYYYYYRHALKFGLLPGFELTKVWDENREEAEKLAKVFLNKPHVCKSLEEASDDVDLVFVADCSREGEYHLAYAAPGLRKGVATFVDKPFAYTLADAREIVRLAQANNTPVMSSSLLRQNPYGEYFRNRFVEIGPVGEGFVKGYGLSGLGGTIHGLSLAQQVFGEGAEWVECTTGRMPLELVRLHYAPNRPDIAPDGLDVIVMSSYLLGPCCGYQCIAYGKKGSIMSPWIDDYIFPLGGQVIMNMCREMVRTRRPQIPYESMLELIEIVEAARRSQETGRPVALKDVRGTLTTQQAGQADKRSR